MVQARSAPSKPAPQKGTKKKAVSAPARAKKAGRRKAAKNAPSARAPSAPKKKAAKKAARTARNPSLLILHLDAAKLRSDGLHLVGPASFASAVAALGMRAEVEAVDATDLQSLLRQLQDLAERKRKFDVVVAVGHSNADGIRIAADMFVDWEAFAGYLRPFEPRRLLLVACQAGLSSAGNALFRKLPKLRRIYASPVNASKLLGELMVILAPLVLETKAPTQRQVSAAHGMIVALTGCQLREWKRGDRDDPEAGMLLDRAAELLDPLARQVPGFLKSLLR